MDTGHRSVAGRISAIVCPGGHPESPPDIRGDGPAAAPPPPASAAAAPPPPAPAPVGVAHKGAGGGGRKYPKRYVLPEDGERIGHFLATMHSRSIDMHCYRHPDCAISRSYIGWDGDGTATPHRLGRGRPSAFFLAWRRHGLQLPEGLAGRVGHGKAAKGSSPASAYLQDGKSAERARARDDVEADTYEDVRGQERPPRDGEDKEPTGSF